MPYFSGYSKGEITIFEKVKNFFETLPPIGADSYENAFHDLVAQYGSEGEEYLDTQDLIDSGVSIKEAEVKTELLEKLKEVDPYYFEKVILILLKNMGYGDFVETSKSGDGGIDGIINEDKLGLEKIYTQAKRYNDNKVRNT